MKTNYDFVRLSQVDLAVEIERPCMLILENSTKPGLKHRVIRKVMSLNFAQKNWFYKRTRSTIK